MMQKAQKNATEENFYDPLVKLMAQNQEEKTGIEKVKDLIELEYYEEAILMCNQALSVNKRDFLHMIQKVRAYIKSQKYDNENIIPLMIELEKSYPQCLKDVEYAEAKYDYYLNTNNFSNAEEFQGVLKSIYGEKNSKFDACIAQLHIKRGKHNDALEVIERGLKLNEYDGLLYELKGDILNQQFNLPEEALQQFQFSTQMNKRNPALFEKMALIFYNKHYYGDAVQYATVTLEQINSAKDKKHLTQQQRHSILIRGSSYLYLKEFDEAQNNFQRILDFDEKCIQSRMGKAYACMYKGKSDQAVAVFKKGEELNSSYPDYASYMALAYFMRKDYDNCEIQLKKYFKKFTSQQEGSANQPQNIFNLLNYVNFFYLDEPYAKASMEKVFSTLDISTFKLSDIEIHFLENLSKYEGIKRSLLEYLQHLMLYLSTGLYRWYPEDLYPFLLKHQENEDVQPKLAHIYTLIRNNKQTAKKKYQQRIQLYTDLINNEDQEVQKNSFPIIANTETYPVINTSEIQVKDNENSITAENNKNQINVQTKKNITDQSQENEQQIEQDSNTFQAQKPQNGQHQIQNIKDNKNHHHNKPEIKKHQDAPNKKDSKSQNNKSNIQQKQTTHSHQKNDSQIEMKQIQIKQKSSLQNNQNKSHTEQKLNSLQTKQQNSKVETKQNQQQLNYQQKFQETQSKNKTANSSQLPLKQESQQIISNIQKKSTSQEQQTFKENDDQQNNQNLAQSIQKQESNNKQQQQNNSFKQDQQGQNLSFQIGNIQSKELETVEDQQMIQQTNETKIDKINQYENVQEQNQKSLNNEINQQEDQIINQTITYEDKKRTHSYTNQQSQSHENQTKRNLENNQTSVDKQPQLIEINNNIDNQNQNKINNQIQDTYPQNVEDKQLNQQQDILSEQDSKTQTPDLVNESSCCSIF